MNTTIAVSRQRHPSPSKIKITTQFTLVFSLFFSTGVVFSADPLSGKNIYNRCIACHSLEVNRTGPKHCRLFGRKAGTVKGFDYSDSMRKSKIVWNDTTLDNFLKAPLQNIPGTIMGYAGIKDDKERGDLIAYLKQASLSPGCK